MRKNEAGLWEVPVDSHVYEFEKWGAEESLDTLLDISAIIGGPIGSAIAKAFAPGAEGMESQVDVSMLGVVLDQLFKNMRKDVVKPLIKKLCSERVLCDGKPIKFNLHYQDDLMHMFRVVKAALEVQYGNFFEGLQGAVGFKRNSKDSIPALAT